MTLSITRTFVLGLALLFTHSIASARTETNLEFVSLEDLIKADVIFVGVAKPIEKVNGRKPTLDGLPARLTEFRIVESLKGGFRPGALIRVKQFEKHSTPIRDGEIVLWYLNGKPNQNVFANPVGYFSGDFRRVSEEGESENFLLRNSVGNRGLWSSETGGQLWNTTTFQKDVAAKHARLRLLKRQPELHHDPQALEKLVGDVLSFGDRPCKIQSLPVDFLLAVTAARLEFSVH